MNRPQRSIEIFTMSALDLFVTAMGSFAILMMILFPYYDADRKKAARAAEQREKGAPADAEGVTAVKGDVLFGVWPVRVQDYEKFVEETGYDGTYEDGPLDPSNVMAGDAWRQPGFEQGPTHPVVGVSWIDARAFCKWLTKKERESGAIGPLDEYRLPTADEWSAAIGATKYPWGDTWPPPGRVGNLSGTEFARPLGYAAVGDGTYEDGFVFTSPVDAFPANRYGIHDLAGNVAQWCLDWFRDDMNPPELREAVPYLKTPTTPKAFRTFRGLNWFEGSEPKLQSRFHDYAWQELRLENLGFRCVLVVHPQTAP
jgi:formylglycine-generating enzyme required for sulfatase activity